MYMYNVCTCIYMLLYIRVCMCVQVVPSVQGLDLKLLKTVLKKESSYTTILGTARIRGTEKIRIIDQTSSSRRSHDDEVLVVRHQYLAKCVHLHVLYVQYIQYMYMYIHML